MVSPLELFPQAREQILLTTFKLLIVNMCAPHSCGAAASVPFHIQNVNMCMLTHDCMHT